MRRAEQTAPWDCSDLRGRARQAGLYIFAISSALPPQTATVAFTQPGSIGGDFPGVTVKSVSVNTKVTLSATLGSRTLTLSVVLLRSWRSGDKITLTPLPGPGPFYGPSFGYEYFVQLSNPASVNGNGLSGTATTNKPNDVQDLMSEVDITPGCDNTVISFQVPYESAPVHATVTVNLGGSTAETVYLQSVDGILTVPASVTIPAGQISVTFPVTTVQVTSDSQVFVNASHIVSSQLADSVESNTTTVTP